MKKHNSLILIAALCTLLGGCRRQETIDPNLQIPGIGGYVYEDITLADGTNLDEWLRKTFLKEYNIEVTYRWDAEKIYSHGTKHKLVPMKVEKVKPMMEVLAEVWFKPYIECAPAGFLQRLAPKSIILIGSSEYAEGGNVVLGTAEGGVKIFITNGNAFSSSNRSVIKGYLHTIEHEFTHVLNQNRNYKSDFDNISTGEYKAKDWGQFSDAESWKRGFISNYAMSSPGEDYAEVLSLLLVNGLKWFEEDVLPIAEASKENSKAAEQLRAKAAHVENYLRTEYKIHLYDRPAIGKKGLITQVQEAINYVVENGVHN